MALPAVFLKAKGALKKAGKAKAAANTVNSTSEEQSGNPLKRLNGCLWFTPLGCLFLPIILLIFLVTIFSNVFGIIQIADGATTKGTSGDGGTVDTYTEWAADIANDDSHGYSMGNRTGNPDYDCSSLVYYALINAGIKLSVPYAFATPGMPAILKEAGFTEYSFTGNLDNLQKGDILVYPGTGGADGHTEIYYGDGQTVGVHSDYDGVAGDGGGNEITIAPFAFNSATLYYRWEQ